MSNFDIFVKASIVGAGLLFGLTAMFVLVLIVAGLFNGFFEGIKGNKDDVS